MKRGTKEKLRTRWNASLPAVASPRVVGTIFTSSHLSPCGVRGTETVVSEGRACFWLPETASSDSRTSQGLIRDGVEQVGRGGTRPYRTDRTTWKSSLPMTLNASLPTEIMRPALKRPVVQSLGQALPHRVFADVLQFVFVFPLIAQAVV